MLDLSWIKKSVKFYTVLNIFNLKHLLKLINIFFFWFILKKVTNVKIFLEILGKIYLLFIMYKKTQVWLTKQQNEIYFKKNIFSKWKVWVKPILKI